MRVLGIETSCDETGVALYDSEKGLLGHKLYSQAAKHAEYGGVVPELASRDHIQKTLPLIKELLKETNSTLKEVTGLAYTAGPGLSGALLVGAGIGRSLGWALGVPTIGIHHMEGHLLAPLLEEDVPEFPFIALLISGGHSLLVQVAGIGKYEILGDTLDDAVGEAFDKVGKLLGLGYPGGAALEKLAATGDPKAYHFPRPMTDRPGLDFSFSGIKTHVATTWRQSDQTETTRANVARAFQDAVVETLAIKCKRAIQETNLNRLVIAGGVSANKALRTRLDQMAHKLQSKVYYPRHEFCGDNGAMIAYVGYQRLKAGQKDNLEFRAQPRWSMAELSVPK